MATKKVFLTLSYNEAIKFWYKPDIFNQCLNVGISTKVPSGMYYSFLNDCIGEAYEHYNALNKDEAFIHPDSVVNS